MIENVETLCGFHSHRICRLILTRGNFLYHRAANENLSTLCRCQGVTSPGRCVCWRRSCSPLPECPNPIPTITLKQNISSCIFVLFFRTSLYLINSDLWVLFCLPLKAFVADAWFQPATASVIHMITYFIPYGQRCRVRWELNWWLLEGAEGEFPTVIYFKKGLCLCFFCSSD